MDSEYQVKEYSGFSNLYKKVRKHYQHSFDEDYDKVIRVIKRSLPLNKGDFKKISDTVQIAGLGDAVKLPIAKTRVHIKQARDKCGRLVYLVDNLQKTIFLIDVYYKSDRENHDAAIISKAYQEYLDILESEPKQKDTKELATPQ